MKSSPSTPGNPGQPTASTEPRALQLRSEDVSVVVVEQYVDRVLASADYVYVLTRGGIGFAGLPGDLAGTDVFQQYIGAEN
jgi:ABC-type branched-subunit amino acid transport system ATPase component